MNGTEKTPQFVAIAMALIAFTQAAHAAPLAAHRAFYDFTIGRNEKGSGYSDVRARLAYEITGSECEGWSVNYRFAGKYVRDEGNVQTTDTQLTSWEAGDGMELRVNQKNYVDNNLASENKVVAKRGTSGNPGKGEITAPSEKTFEIEPATLFPVLYQSTLLNGAAKGHTRDAQIVYDGTDAEKVYRVITIIGKPKDGKALSADARMPDAAPLQSLPSWPMATSYFVAGDDSSDQPIYQSYYTMYENGVSTDLTFDYGDYTLKGKLAKLEMLKTAACN